MIYSKLLIFMNQNNPDSSISDFECSSTYNENAERTLILLIHEILLKKPKVHGNVLRSYVGMVIPN